MGRMSSVERRPHETRWATENVAERRRKLEEKASTGGEERLTHMQGIEHELSEIMSNNMPLLRWRRSEISSRLCYRQHESMVRTKGFETMDCPMEWKELFHAIAGDRPVGANA